MTTSDGSIGLRLLQLQREFLDRERVAAVSSEFNQPDWQPRPETVIAAEYEAALRELVSGG